MNYFLIIFSVLGAAHIIFIITKKMTLRHISKILIIPVLLAAYITKAGTWLFFPILALAFGWVGDVLLLKINKKLNFILGLASFLIGHLCYIFAFLRLLNLLGLNGIEGNVNITALLIFTPQAIILGIVVLHLVKPSAEMFIPVIFYMLVLLAMGLAGFQVFLLTPGMAGLLIVSGSFNFMISDTLLAYYTFRKPKISGSVLIMTFYILAQAEIIIGLLELHGSLFSGI